VVQAAAEFYIAAIVCNHYLVCDEQYYFHIRPQYIPKNGFSIMYHGKDSKEAKEKYVLIFVHFVSFLIARKFGSFSRKESMSHHKEIDDSDYMEPLIDIFTSRPPYGKRISNISLTGIHQSLALLIFSSNVVGGGKPDHLTYSLKLFKLKHHRAISNCTYSELEKAVFLPDNALVLDGGTLLQIHFLFSFHLAHIVEFFLLFEYYGCCIPYVAQFSFNIAANTQNKHGYAHDTYFL
jgi:hypothetical protein